MPAPPRTTLKEVVNLVATSVGHPEAADVVGSADEAIRRLIYYVNTSCMSLTTMHAWEKLTRQAVIPIVADSVGQAEKAFVLPVDFGIMKDDTHWNRSTQLPAVGPVNSQVWQAMLVRNNSSVFRFMWRLRDGRLWIKSPPQTSQDLTFEYQSKNWANDKDDFGKDYMDKNDDYHVYPWELVVFFARYKWLSNEGYDAKAAQADFQTAFDYETGTDHGATVLSLVPHSRFPYIDAVRNTPDSGYGLP